MWVGLSARRDEEVHHIPSEACDTRIHSLFFSLHPPPPSFLSLLDKYIQAGLFSPFSKPNISEPSLSFLSTPDIHCKAHDLSFRLSSAHQLYIT